MEKEINILKADIKVLKRQASFLKKQMMQSRVSIDILRSDYNILKQTLERSMQKLDFYTQHSMETEEKYKKEISELKKTQKNDQDLEFISDWCASLDLPLPKYGAIYPTIFESAYLDSINPDFYSKEEQKPFSFKE